MSHIFGHVLVSFLLIFSGCKDKEIAGQLSPAMQKLQNYTQKSLLLPSGEKLHTFIAQSAREQVQGLSGIQDKEFLANFAMFFPGEVDQERSFWMPDTYFNLDIIFLDKDMKVVEIARDTTFHPGRNEPPSIAKTQKVFCRHVLEVKSSSELSKKIRFGQQLKWED